MVVLAGIQNRAVSNTTLTSEMNDNNKISDENRLFSVALYLLTMLSRMKRNTLFMLISSMMSQNRSTTSCILFSQTPCNHPIESVSQMIILFIYRRQRIA